MSYPTTLDNLTTSIDCDTSDTLADIANAANTAINALQTKVGVDSSAVTTSLDYLLKSTSSSNPGHKHTLATGATDVTATYTELNYNASATPGSATASKTVVLDSNKDYSFGTGDITATIATLTSLSVGLPAGHMVNGKIAVSVTSNNLTVALQTLAGADPSSSSPVYVRIGSSIRAVTSSLSVTCNAATNWFNSGGSELATLEADYFVYLGWKAASSAVVIGFARIPCGSVYSQFSSTSTDETYLAYSSAPASTDDLVVIGRFAATLSAGAGYTWSVPTFTTINLLQRPVFCTRRLTFTPARAVSGGTVPTYTAVDNNYYEVINDTVKLASFWQNTSGGTAGAGANPLTSTLPFKAQSSDGGANIFGYSYESGGTIAAIVARTNGGSSNSIKLTNCAGSLTDISGADQSSTARQITLSGTYFIKF